MTSVHFLISLFTLLALIAFIFWLIGEILAIRLSLSAIQLASEATKKLRGRPSKAISHQLQQAAGSSSKPPSSPF